MEICIDNNHYVIGQGVDLQDQLLTSERNQTSLALVELNSAFVRLKDILPEEMNPEQQRLWATVRTLINVDETLNLWPTIARVPVEVISVSPCKILPYGGVEACLDRENLPDGFNNLKPGDWITAVCVYDQNYELLRIDSFEPREPMPIISDTKANEIVKSMRSISSFSPIPWEEI